MKNVVLLNDTSFENHHGCNIVIKNIKRKDDEFQYMRRKMSVYVKKYVRENLQIEFKELDKSYNPKIKVEIPNWVISEE